MKRTILLFSIVGGLSILALSSYKGGLASSSATTQNCTNVPGNVPGCGNGSGCHAPGLASSINVGITVIDLENNTPVDSTWVPGHQYHVIVGGISSDTTTLDHFGFQCAVSTAIGAGGLIYRTGTFTPVSGIMDGGTAEGCDYVEQIVNIPGKTGSFNTYVSPQFEWDADTSTT